jgi:hypothetical protein
MHRGGDVGIMGEVQEAAEQHQQGDQHGGDPIDEFKHEKRFCQDERHK